MKNNKRIYHIIVDIISSISVWILFFSYRKYYIESDKYGYEVPVNFNFKFFLSLAIISGFWMLLYYLMGTYRDVFRKSRLSELGKTLSASILGVTVIFFLLILDDEILGYRDYYRSYVFLLSVHFALTFIPRLILVTDTVKKVHNRIIGFNTLMVGSNEKALNLFKELESQKESTGHKFIGFVQVDNHVDLLIPHLPYLGDSTQINQIIEEKEVEEVIIAVESSEHENIGRILNAIDKSKVMIKIIPDMYDILSGSVKMTSIFDAPLIEVRTQIMPLWQQNVKRVIDLIVSILALLILSPLLLLVAISIKIGSKGPIFYFQERIGKNGKPFKIIKFRSMFIDAEANGPALSSSNDDRVTKTGKFIRKYRIDELPNFINVLKGEMSLVGPRPERQYFINKITEIAPHYIHLLKVTPGVTSWGQVKYGYAENVEQMIERLKYDLLYIENMSLLVDFKILIYTVLTVLKGRGK